MELDLCVVLLFGLCVSNVINAESTGKVSEEKYTYTKFEGYDIEMEQTKNLHGREIAKIKSHNKKSSDLIDRCKDKCSHEYEEDCNIVIYKPDENQCLLMDCGENAGNCYFISSEDSKASGKGEGNTIILQRTEEKEQPEVKGPSDIKKSEPKSSEEDDEDESTTAEAAVQTQKRKGGEVVVGNSKPAQAESDPFSFPASPSEN